MNKPAAPAYPDTNGQVDRTASPSGAPSGRGQAPPVDEHDQGDSARRGDRDAFRTLFQRYHWRAYALALGVVRSPDDALDVVQDAFIKAHRHLDKFEGTSSFYTWLYRIVMNLAIDHLRKHKRARPVELDERALEAGDSVLDDSLLPRILGGNPGRALLDKEIRGRIDAALDTLSENHRAVLVMRELDGLSYEEMATVMACSKGTIMSRLFHARKNMQRRLGDLKEGRAVSEDEADAADEPAELEQPRGCGGGTGRGRRSAMKAVHDLDLMQRADRELDPGAAGDVDAAIAADPGAAAKVAALGELGELVRGHLELGADAIADARFDAIWREVDKGIDREASAAAAIASWRRLPSPGTDGGPRGRGSRAGSIAIAAPSSRAR